MFELCIQPTPALYSRLHFPLQEGLLEADMIRGDCIVHLTEQASQFSKKCNR